MSIVRQGTLPVGSLDHAITLNVQSSGGSHFETVTDTTPYLHRASPQDVASSMKLKKVVGGTIAWNQLIQNGNFTGTTGWTSQNVGSTLSVADGVATITHNGTSNLSPYNPALGFASGYMPRGVIGHLYYIYMEVKSPITSSVYFGGNPTGLSPTNAPVTANTWTEVQMLNKVPTLTTSGNLFAYLGLYKQPGFPSGGELQFRNINVYDLTQMFGSTIADYIASLEQAHAGDGVAWFKALFGEDYYPYNSGELLSVKTSARKTYNADNVEIGSYALDGDLELRGIPKLDGNNELYYDGDTYASDGTVTRKYGIRAYTEGDVTDGSTMITDGTNTVYKLITPTTESADAYTQSQRVGATEEFVDGRTVEIPVGNVSEYKRLIQGGTP